MTALAPTLQAFFTTRLGQQRDASPHTIDSYRHAFRLLLTYAKARTGKDPARNPTIARHRPPRHQRTAVNNGELLHAFAGPRSACPVQ